MNLAMNTSILLRGILAVLLLAAALFCCYGFLASHEPGVSPVWKIGYAVAGVALVLGAGALVWPRKRSN